MPAIQRPRPEEIAGRLSPSLTATDDGCARSVYLLDEADVLDHLLRKSANGVPGLCADHLLLLVVSATTEL